MTYRSEFTDDEWKILQNSPWIACLLVAGSDGVIDKKELREMFKQMTLAAAAPGLLGEVLKSTLDDDHDPRTDLILLAEEGETASQLVAAGKLVNQRMPDKVAEEFKVNLLRVGYAVANASGGGFLGFGSKVSEEERTSLAVLASSLSVRI